MRGVGREIHFLTKGFYRIMDRTLRGATIEILELAVKDNLREMEPGDLAVVEGGGNALLEVGERRTLSAMEDIVKIVKERVGTNPLVMCIPKRHGWEGSRYEGKRRWVNDQCIGKLEEWGCDGLQLWENMRWEKVWARDGVHLSNLSKVWVG